MKEIKGRRETPEGKLDKKGNPLKFSRDIESNWTTKNDKHYYGLKEHTAVDAKHGFVLATVLSRASVNDTNYLPYCTIYSRHIKNKLAIVYADKGYAGSPNREFLAMNELKDGIMRKGWKPNTPLPTNSIPVIEVSSLAPDSLVWGCPNGATGLAMARYIEIGVELTRQGIFQGLTTCPISKKSLNDAGYSFPGHTEMLASLTKTSNFAMMMAGSKLRVTLVTIHRPLREVADALSIEEIFRLIMITHTALMVDFGIPQPRLAVAGLNPHAGEEGLFGDEEKRLITPAIALGRQQGLNVSGPFPPDTVYSKAASGEFDAVVSMYHDQGLIPFKLLHFDNGVNVTLGLPIIRTSVDHGTAYDIAGKGLAKHSSLAEAVRLAATMSDNRAIYRDTVKQRI